MSDPHPRVIVVGAGLSGLVCARRLARAGIAVVVVEARSHPGGRIRNGEVGGMVVDLGAQWLTVGQDRLVALAAELDVETFDHARTGTQIVDERGNLFAKIAAAFAQHRAIKLIDDLAAAAAEAAAGGGVGISAADRERLRAYAASVDQQAFATWLEERVPNVLARERIRLHADLVFATDLADLSLLSYLATLHATGGFRPEGPDLPGGGREHRFVGGAQALIDALVDELSRMTNVELMFDTPIAAIEDQGTSVIAQAISAATGSATSAATSSATSAGTSSETSAGTSLETSAGTSARQGAAISASRLVLAIPPACVRDIEVPLSVAQRTFLDGVRTGAVVKCFAVYARPFWRDRGLSGEAYLPRGPVRATVELIDGPRSDGCALLAFVVGTEAARWSQRDPDERRRIVVDTLVAHFGDEARDPIGYLEQDWGAERWSGGCVASTSPGTYARGGAWRAAHGNVHIAGTESATRWPGYMDGAIEAGARAADEVIAALGDKSTQSAK